MEYIGVGLTSLGLLGAAIGVGMIVAAMLNGVARNPSAEAKLSKYMFIGAALSEAMGLFAFVIAILLMFVK